MAEHQIRRRWIKLWTQETLHGTTTKELAYDEVGMWFLLLCKAGDSPEPGVICIDKGLGYTTEQLASLFKIPIDVYKRAEQKLIEHNKISKNGDNTIKIVNWDKYQGFDRTGYMTPYMRDWREKQRVKSDGKTNGKSNSKQINNKQ